MFILVIDVDDDTRSVVFNDLSLHDKTEYQGLYFGIIISMAYTLYKNALRNLRDI